MLLEGYYQSVRSSLAGSSVLRFVFSLYCWTMCDLYRSVGTPNGAMPQMCAHSALFLRGLALRITFLRSSWWRQCKGEAWAYRGTLTRSEGPAPSFGSPISGGLFLVAFSEKTPSTPGLWSQWCFDTFSHTCRPTSLGSPVYKRTVSCSLGAWGPALARVTQSTSLQIFNRPMKLHFMANSLIWFIVLCFL